MKVKDSSLLLLHVQMIGGNFGREGCIYFASRGAYVSALDNNLHSLEETVALVQQKVTPSTNETSTNTKDCSRIIQTFYCDVSNASSVQEAVDKAVQSFGIPHLLWNNAGYQGQIRPTLEYSIEDFATVMNINVTGMFIVLQTVAKYMSSEAIKYISSSTSTSSESSFCSSSRSYAIVNTASVAALRGTPAMIAYASSKAAVLAMTVAAAKGMSDLCVHRFKVNKCWKNILFLFPLL